MTTPILLLPFSRQESREKPELQDVYIIDVGTFLPNQPIENDHIEPILGIVGDRPSRARKIVLKNNGIKSRYYAIDPNTGKPTHSNTQLTALAIRNMERNGRCIDDIDCLVCGTSSPDQLLPSHAVMVHGELGTAACEVASFSGICVSGIQALKYAAMSIMTGQSRSAVATGSELASAVLNSNQYEAEIESRVNDMEQNPALAFGKDFLRWMLSDGAGAAWLSNIPSDHTVSLKIEWIDIYSHAGELPVCMYQGGTPLSDGGLRGFRTYPTEECAKHSMLSLEQDVKLLNQHIINSSTRTLVNCVRKHQLDLGSIDYFLPHLSSEYFRQRLYDAYRDAGLEIASEKWFTNLTRVGNVGSASIYLMLAELLHSGRLKNGQRLLLMVPESGRFTMTFTLLTVCG